MSDQEEKKDQAPPEEDEGSRSKFEFKEDEQSTNRKLTIELLETVGYEGLTDEEKKQVDELTAQVTTELSSFAVKMGESISKGLGSFTEQMAGTTSKVMEGFSSLMEGLMPAMKAISEFLEENKDILDDIEHWEAEAKKRGVDIGHLMPYEFVELVRQWQALEEQVKPYFPVPSTPLTKLTKQILNNPHRVQSTKKSRIQQKDLKLTDSRVITYTGKDQQITIELENIKNLFSGKARNGAKVFTFLCQKLNEQSYKEITHFSLSELVDNGIYKTKNTAYKGLKNILDTLYSVSIEAVVTEYQGGNKKEVRNRKARLIAERDVTWNLCQVSFPPIMREGMKHITILPQWSYTLSDNAFMLLDYVYTLARQRTIDVKNKGYFTISLEAARIHLGLPTIEEAGKDPGKRIKNVIESALEEIEAARDIADKEKDNAEEARKSLLITPIFDYGTDSTKEYLKGYLKVELDENAQEYMNKRAIEQEKKLALREKAAKKEEAKAALKAAHKVPIKDKLQ